MIIFLLSIANVFAIDENQTENININYADSTFEVDENENSDLINNTKESEIISTGENTDKGTFAELQTMINDASEGNTIYLLKDYFSDNTNIKISKAITIEGNGFALDGLGKSKILQINTENYVVLNNMVFKNAKDNAVEFNKKNSNSAIKNCIFENGIGTYGGAILFNNNVENLIIDSTKFINNKKAVGGGAIYFTKESNNNIIRNCEFVGNSARTGGAISFENNVNNNYFINNEFITNNATTTNMNYGGGAIYFEKDLKNSVFENNKFLYNNATTYGGAIYINGNDINNTMKNSTFTDNNAKNYGGAIFINKLSHNSKNSNLIFKDNSAEYGGAILFNSEVNNLTIEFCEFEENKNAIGGGAIYFKKESKDNQFKSIDFSKNIANAGGALYFENNVLNNTFELINFNNNNGETKNYNYGGGAIFIEGNAYNNNFSNSSFINNAAINGGALNVKGNLINNTFKNIEFTNNIAQENGGALYIKGNSQNNEFSATFNDNNAKEYGGAVYFNGESKKDSFKTGEFNKNNANYGGAILFNNNAENTIISQYTFSTNNAIGGGSIYFKKESKGNTIVKCEFTNNIARSGGAIFFEADVDANYFNNNNFTQNSAVTNNSKYGGGAIYSEKTMKNSFFENENFNYNSARIGGAIYLNNIENTIFLKNNFVENIANNGSAIFINNGANSDILNSTFINNTHGIEIAGSFKGNIAYSTFEGKSQISVGKNAEIKLSNNIETGTYDKTNPFILNKGVLSLDKNILTNLISNEGNIISNTSITVLNNETYTTKEPLVCLNASCIDDNNNYITGNNIRFDINDSYIALPSNDKYEYAYYYLENPGEYEIDASLDNTLSNCNHKTAKIIYNAKAAAFLNVENVTININEYAKINVNLPDDATGLIRCDAENESYAAVVKNGHATFIIPNLELGIHETYVYYLGDDNYNHASAIGYINVTSDKSLKITIKDVVKYYKGNERLIINITEDNKPVVGKTVEITVNNVPYIKTTNNDGIASLAINLNSGNYIAYVKIDDKIYTAEITVISTITVYNMSKIFKNSTQYYAYFLDSQGNPLSNVNVTFNINGVFYERTTDENGVAKLNINLHPGEYICTAINPSNGETKSSIVKVISQFVEHEFSNITYIVKILSKDGTPAPEGEEVVFNIKGQFYSRTTNSTGHVVLNITLMKGEHIITAKYKDEEISDKITIY